MGFQSWKTSEGQSIPNIEASRPTFTVWMVMPDGTRYEEDAYDGYGEFGGEDFYAAVAELNGHAGLDLDSEDLRRAGIGLYFAWEEGRKQGVVLPRFTSDTDKKWDDLKDPEYCQNQGFFYDA